MKLPKTVYIVVENEGTDEEYLAADPAIENVTEKHKRKIGIYRLEDIVETWLEVRTKK